MAMPLFTQPFTLTAQSGPAVGPVASSGFITADFTNLTGNTLPATLFGVGISSQSDINNGGAFRSSGITDPQVISTFKNLNGSIPGTFLRWNLENNGQNGDGSINTFYVDSISNFTPQLIDINTGTFSYNVGNQGASPSQNAAGAGQVYDRFLANGVPCLQYEVFNELDGVFNAGTYNNHFVAISQVLHQRNPNCIVIGNNYASENQGDLQSLASASGSGISRCDRFHWHNYQAGPDKGSWPMSTAFDKFANRDVGDARTGIRNGGRGNTPQGCGEYNMDGNPDGQPLQYQIAGAIYNNLAMWGCITSDPFFTHGLLWQAFADDGYGQIVDHVMATNKGLTYLSMVPAGHAFAICRRFLPGNIVNIANQPGGNLAVMATVNNAKFGVWLINYDEFSSVQGTVALSHWPVNSTGNGTIQRWEVSPAHLAAFQSSVGVSNGVTQSITLPAKSVTVLTSG